MTRIYKAKDKIGIWIVNGTAVNLRKWRNGQRFDLKQCHINNFDKYIDEYKLYLS
jgi:hypothetical protein